MAYVPNFDQLYFRYICVLGAFLHVVIRCLYLEGTREFLTFLPFACLPLIVVVNFFFTSRKGLREMNTMTFRVLASILFALFPHLQSKPQNLVEVFYFLLIILAISSALFSVVYYFAPNSSSQETIIEERLLMDFYRLMLQIVAHATHLSSLVLLISAFMSFQYRVVGEPAKSEIFELFCCVIIVLFSILPYLIIGPKSRLRNLSSISTYFLAFTLLLFVSKLVIRPLDLEAELVLVYDFMNNLVVNIFLHLLDVCLSKEYDYFYYTFLQLMKIEKRRYADSSKIIQKIKDTQTIAPTGEKEKKKNGLKKEQLIAKRTNKFFTRSAMEKQEEEERQHHVGQKKNKMGPVTSIAIDHDPSNMSSLNSLGVSSEGKIYLQNYYLYFSLFPPGYEFTRDTLVWSWIAAGIIKPLANCEMKETRFNSFINSKIILPSGYDHLSDQVKYKLEMDMSFFSDNQYRRGLDRVIHFADRDHLSLIFEEIDELQFKNLRSCSNLKTLLLHKCYGSEIENLLNNLFLELKLLTLIDLSCTNVMHLPSSVENLTALVYLDMSQTPIRWLPESIGSLCNLETLVLLGCQSLCGLPRSICKLINLQHLELDIARQLQSTPIGIGNLVNLQSLRTFVVGRKDGNGIGELMYMDKLKGSLCILKLENVMNKEEAEKARLRDKKYLTKIEFLWSDLENDEVVRTEEEILENFRPHDALQELNIVFYSGGVFPSWISDPSFSQMVNITLSGCRFCEKLPSFGELPSLKFLSFFDMDAVVDIDFSFCRKHDNQDQQNAFPQLEKLSFDGMSVLENWSGVVKGDFPCLVQLVIKYCPKLVSLPSLSNLESLQVLEIINCPELPCLPEGGIPSSVKCPMVKDCPKLKT
ncbi:hypothetical protein ACJIZ3_005569 [Penstemon smallii]|uniref:R13L1/DRL21-like LRR repeat region domain-containing protein n=1 Tax=Penstemon smallii TaxID=265156 RepID=A0ABD3S588_9LAMI